MALAKDYISVMSRKGEIMKKALGMDFSAFENGSTTFGYEEMMSSTGFPMEGVERMWGLTGMDNTPLFTLRNLTALARKYARPGYGATVRVKNEMTNPSDSFKARWAACAVAFVRAHGYKGIIAATSSNYGAAVASQAAVRGLKYITAREAYDSREMGRPKIIEEARACEAIGTEIVQIIVSPELFYESLSPLEDTGLFDTPLYSFFGITGIETLGHGIALQYRTQLSGDPGVTVCINAGGGMATGITRGLWRAQTGHTQTAAVSVSLTGLHMVSDIQSNRESCTTSHTGFDVPFADWPDRSSVPRSTTRPLCYMDHYVIMMQDETMCITELLVNLEGLERDPAGNTPPAAAFCLIQELPEDQILVVSETRYTDTDKHVQPQLGLAWENDTEVRFGEPDEEVPDVSVILPANPYQFRTRDLGLDKMRHSLTKTALETYTATPTEVGYEFLIQETNKNLDRVKEQVAVIVSTLQERSVTSMKCTDDFVERRKHITDLADQELYDRFWTLTEQVVIPLLELNRRDTTPSAERAVLLRVNISSLETQKAVKGCMDRSLMSHDVGHVVHKLSREENLSIPETGRLLAQGKYRNGAAALFKEGK